MKLPAIAAALTLSLPLTALADVSSSAHFSNFHYEVIDLDLNDGITAALTLDEPGKGLTAGYDPGNGFPDPLEYLFEDGTVSATVGAGSATASLENGVGHASASFNGITGELFSTVAVGHTYTLTANTQVILYLDAEVTGGADAGNAWSPSYTGLFAINDDPVTGVPVQTEDYLASYLGNTTGRQLTVSFTSGDTEQVGELGYFAGAYAGVSPVPEPSQVALLTLGLAGFAWQARRARRK